jgi:hypothetical protein
MTLTYNSHTTIDRLEGMSTNVPFSSSFFILVFLTKIHQGLVRGNMKFRFILDLFGRKKCMSIFNFALIFFVAKNALVEF